jgi:hypothetical protein
MARQAAGIVHVVLVLPHAVPEIIVRLGVIADAMDKNAALFPYPPVSIPTFRAHIAKLMAAQVATSLRTVGLTFARDQALRAAKRDAEALCGYVNRLANETPARAPQIAAAAAMILRRFGGRKAGWLTVDMIARGVVQAKAPVLRGAVAYDWQYSNTAGDTWIDLETTAQARCLIPGLAPATTILVRVRAITRKGPTKWSIPAPFIVGSQKPMRKRSRR